MKNLRFLEKGEPIDIHHINSLDIIDQSKILFCACFLGLVGIIDIDKEEIIWNFHLDNFTFPHDATLLKNGNILIFDNGVHRSYTRIIEINPLTRQIVWEYKSSPPKSFFSKTMGAAQRLPNGNTLITESEKAHVFEITPDGKKVWEFYGSSVGEDNKRTSIYRMERIVDGEKLALLRKKILQREK